MFLTNNDSIQIWLNMANLSIMTPFCRNIIFYDFPVKKNQNLKKHEPKKLRSIIDGRKNLG